MEKQRTRHLKELGHELNALLAASRAITSASAERFHPQIQPAAYQIAMVLSMLGAARGSQLSQLLETDKSAISRLLKSLCDLGLAEPVTDPDDRRSTIYRLTQEGQSRVEASIEVKIGAFYSRTEGWSDAELSQLTELLRKFNRHV
ncbi:MarR family winged helix-turn-helix transcriptional regulator [Agrobacterium sp. CFBP2214]|jgi:DNA-binding MarR family transcriptional regulator|uniref:MarR family winged helix-turn-helix transcriptional regulator n=1 Tax=Agrobacterium sp. CFBP2214 TaxID=3040274 RepID=UPI00101A3932|nr:MarR family winged helix-turn-helix transcriptional regulator [Agrobacterium sp. CFBP2214]